MKMKKVLAIFIAIAMVFCYLPATAYAEITVDAIVEEESEFADMPLEGFWSAAALKAAVSNGLLNGIEEDDRTYIKADDPLTRAQMATIVNRAFGAEEKAALSRTSDVPVNAWYYNDMQKAVKMGTMKLDTKMRPNDTITRQEAFTILGRALKMEDGTNADLVKFNDVNDVANWATGDMGAMVKAGYIQGDNNLLTPTANMTRAQFAVIMDNVINQYISTAGTVTEVVAGNVMVNVAGVKLKDVTITGDLIVGDGVGDEELSLDNVVVKGNIIVRGGGMSSIIITGGSINGKIIIAKVDGKIRVFAKGGADIELIEVNDGVDDVIIEGNVGTVEVTVAGTPVIIRDGTIGNLNVNTNGAGDITVESSAKVDSMVVGASSAGTRINVIGTVANFETSAVDTELSGAGTVTNVKVNSGANIKRIKPTEEEQATTLSKDEITSGEVFHSQTSKSISHTFSSEELQGFIDFFNNCKITKSDHKEPTGKHTAMEDSIDIYLKKNDGTTIIFVAFSDGEIYVIDGSDNGYALLNKDLSNYILDFKKYFM